MRRASALGCGLLELWLGGCSSTLGLPDAGHTAAADLVRPAPPDLRSSGAWSLELDAQMDDYAVLGLPR